LNRFPRIAEAVGYIFYHISKVGIQSVVGGGHGCREAGAKKKRKKVSMAIDQRNQNAGKVSVNRFLGGLLVSSNA